MITIYGDIKAKKNNKQIIMCKGRPMLIPSANHKKWHKQALSRLKMAQIVRYEVPCEVEITFYKQTARRYDLSNIAESVMDLLVDAEILVDDNVLYVPRLILNYGEKDKDNPRAEVSIRPIEDDYEFIR